MDRLEIEAIGDGFDEMLTTVAGRMPSGCSQPDTVHTRSISHSDSILVRSGDAPSLIPSTAFDFAQLRKHLAITGFRIRRLELAP